MYIHDYWNNPKKYDIYGDDFVFDLPGTVWELNTGKWLSGPTSQTYLEQTGVPLTREEMGSQRYIDFINSFLTQDEIDNGRWRYKFCVPTSYSTHEDLHPELRIDVDGPDWSVGSARPIRFNNPLNGTEFELHGWEGEEGPNNGVNINTWNTGLAHAFPISERHIITTKHLFNDANIPTNGGWFQFGPKSWYFLNKDNELYKKTFKFIAIDWSDDDYKNFLQTRTAGDALLLELRDNEDGFSSIGIDPSENYAKLNVRGQIAGVEPFFSDSQGKAISTYQLDPQGRGNICHTPILSQESDSDWGTVNAEEASHYMLSDYAKIFEGDSGTLAWCYSPTHGYIFLGGNNGSNNTAIGEPNARRASFKSFEHLIRTGIRLFNLTNSFGPQLDETHPIPLTPIPTYVLPFEFIETPNDLKQEVVRYDLPTEITTKICEVDFKANVSDSFGNTAQTNSITSKTPIESFYDHSEITDDPNQQFPLPHTVRIAVNGNSGYPEELKESTFENEIFDRIYLDFQYGLKSLAPEEVQTVPLHYITCNMEYKVAGSGDWITDINFAGLKPYVRHPVVRSNRSFRSSIFGILSSPDQVEGTEFRVRTKFVSEDFEFETNVPVGTVQDYRRPDNFRLEFDPREVYPGNEFVATLAWDEPDRGANPVPRLSGIINFFVLIGAGLIEYESIDDTTMKVIVSDTAEPGDVVIGSLPFTYMYGPHDNVETTVSYDIIGAPTVSFTDDSTAQDAEVTVGDEIFLEANLTDYVGGTITATINIDGVSVASQTITNATELDGNPYSLRYLVTQENVDQNVDWSYSISVSNLAGDSPVQTRSGAIKQLPKINTNPTTTSPGAVVTNGDEIVIDVDLVNMDANGTATANIVVDGVIVETTTLTSGETSLNLVHTVQNILADTLWSLDVTLTNNFGSVFYSTDGTVDIIETPTIIVNEAVSTSGTIVPGDTIVLEATITNYTSVVGSITINGIDTGASGTLTGDLYRIEYTTAPEEVDVTSNWVSTITASSATESTSVTKTGSIFVESPDGPRSGPFPSNVGVNGGIVETWEPWSVGRTEMIVAKDTGTDIDFGGRGFYMDVNDRESITGMDGITLENFHVVGGPKLEWSGPDSNGIYEADIPGDGTEIPRVGSNFQYSSVTCLSVPRLQKNIPFQACWPTNNVYETWPWDIALNFDFFIRTHDNWSSVGETPGTINSSTGEENQPNRIGDILVSDSTSDTGESYNLNWDNLSSSRREIDGLFRGIKIRKDLGGNDTHLELNAIFQDVEHISPDDPERTKLHIIINADANVTDDFIIDSWDPDHIGPNGEEGGLLRITADGTADDLGNRTWKYRGYAQWIITGKKEFIANRPNRYSISWEDGKIYYKPPNNDWLDTEGNPEAFFPVAGRVFNQGMDYTLKRATFSGFPNKSAASAVVDGAAGEGTTTRLENCLFIGNSTNCREGSWDLYECMMWYPDFRGIAGFGGPSQIIKTNFHGFPRSSAMTPGGPVGDEDSIPGQILPVEVKEILIDGCYFDVTFSNHGQGCSLYTNSWNNVIVTNNIFHNCQRALSFQPGSEPRNPYTAKTIFANNLFLYDRYFGPGLGSGQPAFSFNGGRDTQMPRAEGIDDTAPYVAGEPGSEYDNDTVLTQDPQQVRLWNNTILIDESSFTQEELEKSDVGGWGSIQLEKLISSDVVISNNLIVGSGAPLREDNTGSTGHIFRNNAKVDVDKTGFKYTSGKYDYLNTQFEARVIQTDPIDGFDHENNIIRSTSRLNTSANDGGKLGVRWDSYPTDDVMYNIPVGWYDTYVGSSSNAYEEIGGRTRADFVNDPFVTEDAYAMGGEDRRAYGLPVLVERFTVRRKDDDAGNEPADYTLRDEDIFTPHPSFLGRLPGNVVSHIFLNHGDQVQSEAGGQATNSFDTQENRENFYKKYEIRFRWTDGTVENGSVKNPIPLQPYPAQHTIINGYNGSNSRMLKYDGGPGSDKAPMMGVEEGIWKWEPGCEVEFFIYKLEPFESNQNQDGDTNPREWPEFDETDTTEFPVQGGVVPGDRLYARPVAFFETPAINEYTESVTARVIVHPYNGVKDNGTPNGINRVDFYLNDGTPISVSTPVTYTTDAGFEEVAYEVTYRGSLSQELNEIRAVVWPNVGRVRILQGTGYFSSDGIDIYGVRVDDNTFNPLDWGPGYNTQERGCLLQVTSDTYYISPDGSDVDGNGSSENPYQTPFKVYEEHGTNCVIDNSAYSDNSIALNVADFHVLRNVLDYGYVDRDAFDGRIPLPIIKGGTVIGVPNTEQGLVRPPRLVGENDFPSGEAGQFLEFVPGFIFKNCDIRTPDTDVRVGEFIECIHYSFHGGQGTRRNNTARMIFDNCDFGPSDNAIPELLQQRPFGSSTTGILFEWKQVGQNSPVYLYNCVTRYTHFKNLRENFHCKSVGIGMLDPYNSDKLFDAHIKNVNPFLWPWGPVGETEICNKGEFDDHNPQTNGGGDNGATIQNVLDAVQNLYTELGDPESSKPEFDDDGNLIPGTGPLPNSTYINVVDSVNSDGTPGNVIDPSNWSEVDRTIPYEKNWFLKSESEVDPVAWSELRAIWNAIPTANNQMFPAAVLDTQKVGDFPFKRRTTPREGQSNGASGINIGTIDSIFDNLGRRNGSSDPHVDIQQSFWMSQYRTDLSEPVVDKTWLSNTVAASIRIDGNANGFQGIFHSDASAVLESGFWNLNWESDPETTQANFITLTAGHAGQEYGHTGTHVGPNITRRNPDVAFRMRTDAFNSGVGNITFYENRDTRHPLSANGTVALIPGWPSYPESNPVEMIQNSGISHWYHINVPYTLTVLSSVTFETIPGTNNSTVTEAFNSDRIGTFQPYTQTYTWIVGEEYIENFTSGQLRFGPAVTWNPGNGADTYGAITLTNRSTAPTEWVDTFKRNEHILRVSITIDGNENVYMFDKFNDPFNPQTGYIIIPSNRFDEWDHTRNMTIKMELLST